MLKLNKEYERREFQRVAKEMRRPNAIFVFGSNEAGVHGAGAAREALVKYAAVYGKGMGIWGRSYAIPTKDRAIETLPLDKIAKYVRTFLVDATVFRNRVFVVTRIGCGLAGYEDRDIAPLFEGAPSNCLLPLGWRKLLEEV